MVLSASSWGPLVYLLECSTAFSLFDWGCVVSWRSSDRAARLPRDWEERRAFVRARADGRCEALLRDGSRCPAAGSECDHVARGDDHGTDNLQWLCSWHHKRKTRVEARRELEAARARNAPRARRHPGLV